MALWSFYISVHLSSKLLELLKSRFPKYFSEGSRLLTNWWAQNFGESFPSDKIKSRIIFLSSGLKKSSSISKWSKYDLISELKFSISFCLASLSNRFIKFSSAQIMTFFTSSECKNFKNQRNPYRGVLQLEMRAVIGNAQRFILFHTRI